MRFLVYCATGEGCDYTIGCGVAVTEIDAGSLAEARDKAAHAVSCDAYHDRERGKIRGTLTGDHALLRCIVYAVSDSVEVDLTAARAEAEEKVRREAAAQRNAAKKAELARLLKKHGPRT